MSGRVGHLMEEGAVILGGVLELSQQRQRDAVGGRPVESTVALLMDQTYTGAGQVVAGDGLGGFVRLRDVRQRLAVLGLDALALVDVEDVVVAQEGDFLDLLRLFVFLLKPFPEDHHGRLRALLDAPALLLDLLEGGVFAGSCKQDLIQQTVRLAGAVADRRTGCDPRLLPRDHALLQLLDDAGGHFCVNIFHGESSS